MRFERSIARVLVGMVLVVALVARGDDLSDVLAISANVNSICSDVDRQYKEWLSAQQNSTGSASGAGLDGGATDLDMTMDFIRQVRSESNPERLGQMASQWESIGAMADSQRDSLLRERERDARQAISRANIEYRLKTGRDFNSSNRPYSAGPEQDAWDECHRIHRIYED